MPSEHTVTTPPVPPLTSLYLYLSSGCNLACKHCWISPEYLLNPDKGEYLKFEYIESAVEQAKPLGLQSVKLTGGEPLLHPRFRDIVTLLRQHKLQVGIETNGLLIDEKLARFLGENDNKPFISVSIDGARPETHDRLRGVPGAFRRTIAAIEHLVQAGFHPQVICTLHQGNKDEIAELTQLAQDLGCGSVKFNFIQQIGRGVDFQAKNGLHIEQILEISRYIENEVVISRKIEIIADIPHAFHSIRRILNGKIGRCTALNILGIIADGSLSLCGIGTNVQKLIFGHMKNKNLTEIWQNSPGLFELRKLIPSQFEGICGNCIHNTFCLGSCIANTFYRTGKLNSSYYFCESAEKYKLFPKSRTKFISKEKING